MTQRYVLGDKIASGGMAEIHLGKAVGADGFSRICAFKRVLPHFTSDQEFMKMFYNEAMLSKQLQNKNIVQIFDFVKHEDTYMIVMEYIDGVDLHTVLQTAEQQSLSLSPELACYFAIEVLNGLAYAHNAKDQTGQNLNIIHRDISPQNVLVSFEGDVKLTDFGIAKAANQLNVTQAGVVKGKFRYMSPEQVMGKPIDGRSDLFAIGIVLHELLTMRRLFNGANDIAILEAVRRCQVMPPSQKNEKIPEKLDAIVMKLLQKDLNQRFPNARDASRELSTYLYQYKPDFFPGEVADLMHKLFSDKIELSRKRIKDVFSLSVSDITKVNEKAQNTNQSQSDTQVKAYEPEKELVLKNHESTAMIKVAHDVSDKPAKSRQAAPSSSVRRSPSSVPRSPSSYGSNYRTSSYNYRPHLAAKKKPSVSSSGTFFYVLVFLPLIPLGFFLFSKMTATTLFLDVNPKQHIRVSLNHKPYERDKNLIPPLQIKLKKGSNLVRLETFGFQTQDLTVQAPFLGGSVNQSVQLVASGDMSELRVTTDPPGALVSIHPDYPPIQTPGNLPGVFLGKIYNVTITHPNCETLSKQEEFGFNYINRLINLRYKLNCR